MCLVSIADLGYEDLYTAQRSAQQAMSREFEGSPAYEWARQRYAEARSEIARRFSVEAGTAKAQQRQSHS
jgi:hypothetical protein